MKVKNKKYKLNWAFEKELRSDFIAGYCTSVWLSCSYPRQRDDGDGDDEIKTDTFFSLLFSLNIVGRESVAVAV